MHAYVCVPGGKKCVPENFAYLLNGRCPSLIDDGNIIHSEKVSEPFFLNTAVLTVWRKCHLKGLFFQRRSNIDNLILVALLEHARAVYSPSFLNFTFECLECPLISYISQNPDPYLRNEVPCGILSLLAAFTVVCIECKVYLLFLVIIFLC